MAASNPGLLYRITPRFSAILAMGFGSIGLIGWAADIRPFRVVLDGLPVMSVNTALSLIFCGIALSAMAGPVRSVLSRQLAEFALMLVAVVALLTAGDYMLGMTEHLLRPPFVTRHPMALISAPHTAFALMFISCGLLLYARDSGPRKVLISQYCALAAMGVTFIVLAGYLFSIPSLYGSDLDIGMAVHTLAGLTFLAVGLFNLRADEGLAALYYGDGIGSHLLRSMVPIAGLVVLLYAVFSAWGMQFDKDQGFAVSLLLIVFLVLYALGRAAAKLNVEERHKKLLQNQYTELFEGNPDAIVVTDAAGRITQVNAQFDTLSGYGRTEVIGKKVEMLIPQRRRKRHVQHRSAYQHKPYARAMGSDLDIAILHRDGAEIPVNISIRPATIGAQSMYILAIRDIRERKALLNQLDAASHDALHDALTGLPNRRLIESLLVQAIASAQRDGRQLAVCYCDLDGFKAINDGYGHQGGDALLVEAAQRMRSSVRQEDAIARLGGDEFVIVLVKLAHADDAKPIVSKLIERLSEPYTIGDAEIRVTASVGIAFFPADGAEPNRLIKHADEALYLAKSNGKNQYRIHEPTPER